MDKGDTLVGMTPTGIEYKAESSRGVVSINIEKAKNGWMLGFYDPSVGNHVRMVAKTWNEMTDILREMFGLDKVE